MKDSYDNFTIDMFNKIYYGVNAFTGDPITKTPQSHPYSYEPFVVWENEEVGATGSAYSDRMMQWDYEKFNKSCEEVWGNKGQLFHSYIRQPKDIEKFLQLYFDKPNLKLARLVEGCNVSSGYPYWVFEWG